MAFGVGEASSSSAPTSAAPRSCTYHVFLSFRGEDTRKGFIDHLCAALERKGIRTFKDDKDLERGEFISSELLKAIEESLFAVTVLSPNYASSTWCLDELYKIVECSKSMGLDVVPVFYGVEPSDVRYQKGSFDEAFRKHEGRFGQGSEKIKRWKDALAHIASYSGWDSKDQFEAKLVESIAEHIQQKLIPKLPSCAKNLVGIDSRVKEVISLIGIEFNDVRFVGIWGMGGIGKTTIARVVYETIRDKFQVSCFVRNVRELSETNGFVHLQKDILSRLNISSGFSDVEDGRKIIGSSLCNKKVLLVLDDISQEIQLQNLAWEQDWFGSGSRIIITTRDIHLLNRHGVCGTYEVKGLNRKEARHLFCLKAFKQDEPRDEYLDLSKEVVKYTKGLPLAVEVLGSYLYGRNVDFWHNTVREIRSGPHFEILKALKKSYDHLMPTEKNIFLDIACFFKGKNKDEVTRVLKLCNHYVGIGSEIETGIVTLIDKSLVTLDQDNMLEMHDLLQEMGRHIVYEESPNNPGKRSRLWSENDIDQVLTNDMGTDAIQGIVLHSFHQEYYWSTKAFSKTRQLKFLNLCGMHLPHGLDYLPRSLKVLHWIWCPLETLPLEDQSYQFVEMRLCCSQIKQLWNGKKSLTMLKYLDLSRSLQLKQTPDLSAVPILETLILQNCVRLIEVHSSLVHHKKLVRLNLTGCSKLETLPGMLKMSSLEELILEECSRFKNLPGFGECMKHLSTLSLEKTAIRNLPTSAGYLVGLERLNISWCKSLVSLPDTIGQLKSLTILDATVSQDLCRLPSSVSGLSSLGVLNLSDCNLSEESFPHDFCQLSSLTHLHLDSNPLTSLPIGIQKLPKLTHLDVNYCPKLRLLPEIPSSLRKLEARMCDSLDIAQLISLSNACDIYASTAKGHGVVDIGLIPTGEKSLDFASHQRDGNSVSLPLSNDLFYVERWGIRLYFLLEIFDTCHDIPELSLALYWNGKRLATRNMSPEMRPGRYCYTYSLKNVYLSDEFQEGDLFELLIEGGPPTCAKIWCSAAQWIGFEIMKEDLNRP